MSQGMGEQVPPLEGELAPPNSAHQSALLSCWLLADIQMEKDSSSFGGLATRNLTMLE